MNKQKALIGVQRALVKKGGLRQFIKLAWSQIEPAKSFIPGWHIDVIAEHLEAISKGQLNRLVINIPPGCMKSLTCCVFWPAWVWTYKPDCRWIYASYSMGLSQRDNLRMRRLIESAWYQERWGHVFKPLKDNWGAIKFMNDHAGYRLCTSTDGTVTGEHADVQVCDDPIKPQDARGNGGATRTVLNSCLEWWSETMATRLVDTEKSARVIIMQRLHVHDLAGAILKEGGYEHLCLPMEYEPKTICTTSIGFRDPRQEKGELLWPLRFPATAVEQLKKELGPRGEAAQLQQQPVPITGSLFDKEKIQHWSNIPRLKSLVTSWDCTFKETGSSYVVGQVWGVSDDCEQYFLIDQIRNRLSFSDTLKAIRKFANKYPFSMAHLIEEKANGSAIIDVLKDEIPGLVPLLPQGGKEARAHAIESLWSTGRILLPPIDQYPWVSELIQEILEFPSSLNDDQVDAMTQALTWLRERVLRLKTFARSMNNTGSLSCFL
jgi:predicted phage terminase large subunit-like protein